MSAEGWDLAAHALRLLVHDTVGLRGAVVRMRAGPARDAILQQMAADLPLRKLPPSVSDDHLFGGIDLTASLQAGRAVMTRGFFDTARIALMPMGERCSDALGARLGHLLDTGAAQGVIVVDEGIEVDERVPDALSDRLAFHIAPEGRVPRDWPQAVTPPQGEQVSREDAQTHLAVLAARFGITSMRAPWLAYRAACAAAACDGRAALTTGDIELAAALVFPQRATQMPTPPDAQEVETPEHSADTETEPSTFPETETVFDSDMMIDAVAALLPDGLLQSLVGAGKARRAGGSGAGQKRMSNRRGQPLPPRAGRLDGTRRIDLVATLRSAAPWQPMRRAHKPDASGLIVYPSDIRVKRYAQHSDRLLIFCVDASGSSAMARLGEAKGAIELLLADAYASRDHVALIGFRGAGAEMLLPPTRSLVQTKRRLAALPGGGGTPLAAGLHSAQVLASQNKCRGLSPTLVLLTDGRANIALDGAADRARAAQDATRMATAIRVDGTRSLVIDTGNRPQPALQELGRAMDATYVALPRADARHVSSTVNALLNA